MSKRYEPKDHIQQLDVAPRTEGVLDQREITIHSYQTTVPFDFAALEEGMEGAWLTPQTRFGIFSHSTTRDTKALSVVLGLQDELTVRAYDYDERRPIWYAWKDTIVDTVNVHYFKDEDGLLRFTTTGGGRRITDEKLHEFNSAFLGIPKDAVSKRQFDLDKLRELCFNRFAKRLYMVRFSDPSGEEYRSIDHALFQSRKYIDPHAERLKEISADAQVKIESFDSDIKVFPAEITASIHVRFFIRGLSGSLRLRFPKIAYKGQLKTAEEQTRVFYRIADATVSTILDEDYYTHQQRSLDDLSTELVMFPDMVDLAPYREVLTSAEQRRKFFLGIDLAEKWPHWCPHLRALDELLASDVVAIDVREILGELIQRDPGMSLRLLSVCQEDAKKYRMGALVAGLLADALQAIPVELRAQVEESLLSWAIDREEESWNVDADKGVFGALNLQWRIEDVSFDVLPIIIWKLVGVLYARLAIASSEVSLLLRKFNWCITVAKSLPACHSKSPRALRLVAADRIPKSVADAGRILKEPVADLRALDEAVLDQFGLPLWPLLSASRRGGVVVISNEGIGSGLGVRVVSAGNSPEGDGQPAAVDLVSGESVSLQLPDDLSDIEVHFEKLGKTHQVALPIVGEAAPTEVEDNVRTLPLTISRKRLSEQRIYREQIDSEGIVIGSSPKLLEVFEQIHYANLMEELPPVLLLGEPGVGKTHIAKLLHDSSIRAEKPFKVVNAGGGGGDINIQRGEWVGHGKGHGIQGIDKNGRSGHLINAEGGTLFIDEFASFSLDLQVIFLSVLENRSIEKIGGDSFSPNVRCVFATNADIEEAVSNGSLRRDLLDRIPVKFVIPPLRERRGDILLLARHFAIDQQITDQCLVALLRHGWPGNIRELQSKIAAAKARMKSDGATTICLTHIELPADVVAAVEALNDEACRRELWTLADGIARGEGFEHGSGLQRRAGEILGVGDAQASKMYQEFDLARAASA